MNEIINPNYNEPPKLFGTDWHEWAIKATVNQFKHNQEYNLLHGPLGDLGVAEIDFLTRAGIIETQGEDFYKWQNSNSINLWNNIRKNTLSSVLKGEGYRATNRDIILSAMNKRKSFIDQNYSTWESIGQVQIDKEALEIFEKVQNFDKYFNN